MTRAIYSPGRGAPLSDPTGDRRAQLLARLELVPTYRPVPSPEDREEAAEVELPHRWVQVLGAGSVMLRCVTCGTRGADCAGDHDQAHDALMWRLGHTP